MAYLPHATKAAHGTMAGAINEARVKYDSSAPAGARYVIYCDVQVFGLPTRQVGGTILKNVRFYGPVTLRFTPSGGSETSRTAEGTYDTLYQTFTAHPFNRTPAEIGEAIRERVVGKQVVVQNQGGRWTVT